MIGGHLSKVFRKLSSFRKETKKVNHLSKRNFSKLNSIDEFQENARNLTKNQLNLSLKKKKKSGIQFTNYFLQNILVFSYQELLVHVVRAGFCVSSNTLSFTSPFSILYPEIAIRFLSVSQKLGSLCS